MTVWHRLSTVLWDVVTTYWEEVELFKICHNILWKCSSSKGLPITAAFAVSERSYHHLNIRRLSQGSHSIRCHDIFLFSKCFDCFTHSHNASAVSLIFFCGSEYDQSLVPSPDSAFCLVSTKNVPGPPQTRLKHDYLFICLLRHCRKCSTVGKGLFFFLKLRFLLRERICFNGLALTACRTACWF